MPTRFQLHTPSTGYVTSLRHLDRLSAICVGFFNQLLSSQYVDTAVSKGFPGISENHFLNEAVVLGLRHSLPVPDILDRVHIVGQGHLDRGQYRALLNKTGPGSVRAHIRAVGARLLVVDSIAEAVCRETVGSTHHKANRNHP